MMLYKNVIIIILCCLTFSSNSQNTSNWFEFSPTEHINESVINMKGWMDAPAGNHGYVINDGNNLKFEDNTPVKFWGVNISSHDVFSTNQIADQWSNTLATYGVNAVRFHKFSHPGMLDSVSTQLKAGSYDNMDYFSSKLKEKGIYYGWSPIYGHLPKSGDSTKLLAYKEIANANISGHLKNSTIGMVNFAADLQDLHIELFLNLLNHKNSYTDLKYANDPALIFIEIQNEDNIFFSTNENMLSICPTYKHLLTRNFQKWLKNKYGTHQNLVDNWGQSAIDWGLEIKETNWHLDSINITPITNHGIYGYEYEKAIKNNESLPTFLADMSYYLFELQGDYYNKLTKAIRSTGYRGHIISSNWQAGSGIAHYHNLYADAQQEIIDRHNYYGGGTGHTLIPGKMNNDAMTTIPGSGLLGTGMQQVDDLPFSISEWMSLIPNEWTAEGAPIIAAYGMGLQGWDASYAFGSEYPTFTPALQQPNQYWPGIYNVMSPTQLSLYPALARMIYNNDVIEGDNISKRYVNILDLQKGKLNFDEIIKQNGDVKIFEGLIPSQALAVGKVTVEFINYNKKTEVPKLSSYWDKSSKTITSNTNQLKWNYNDKGYFTINTPCTKGVIGFANCKKIKLENITIQPKTEFATILISSLEKSETINSTKRILVTTMARAQNTGMKYNSDKTELLEPGTAPILLEPVSLKLVFKGKKINRVNVLDHCGNRTNQVIKHKRNKVSIDGKNTKAIYYEIVFE
ncbi:MAG: beta-galactosidase [Saprospiraceae bacterium]